MGMPDWLMIALRTLLAIVVLFFMTKLLGKRQISQLSLFEYITGITIGSLAAYISLELDGHWYLGVVSLAVWVGFSWVIEWLQLKSKRFREFVDGKATVLIKDGNIREHALRRERLTLDELMEQLRSRGAFRAADVEFAIMETSGELNVQMKEAKRSLTIEDAGIPPSENRETQAVIMDGKVLVETLANLDFTEQWLLGALKKKGIAVSQVALAEVDAKGRLYIDRMDE